MKKKLYYLIIKLTKCKPLALIFSSLISSVLKGLYFLVSSFSSKSKSTDYDSKTARELLNNHSAKPEDIGNHASLLDCDESIDLSIIVPAYNAQETVARCIESVISQVTDFTYEMIIVNDGSKDKTQEIIESYLDNKNIKLINQENKGFSGARNTGIQSATAKYFMFLDSDDTIKPTAITNLMKLAVGKDTSIVVGSFDTVYSTKTDKTVFNDVRVQTKKDKPITAISAGFPWGKVFKRELFETVKFPENYLFEDSIMAFLVYPLAQGSVVASTSKSVYDYYKNDAGITATYSKKPKCIDAYWIIEKMYDEYIKADLPLNTNFFNLILGHLKITFWRTYKQDITLRKAIFILSCDLMEKVMQYKPKENLNIYEKNLIKAYQTRNFNLWNMTCLIMD